MSSLLFAVLGLPYFYLYEKFAKDKEEDEFLSLFYIFTFRFKKKIFPAFKLVRGVLIKAFFLPVMTFYLINNYQYYQDAYSRLSYHKKYQTPKYLFSLEKNFKSQLKKKQNHSKSPGQNLLKKDIHYPPKVDFIKKIQIAG